LGYGGFGFGYNSPNFGISYFSPYYGAYRRPYCNAFYPYRFGFGSYYGFPYSSYYAGSYYNSYYVPTPVLAAPICYSNTLPYVASVYDLQTDVVASDVYDYGPAVAGADVPVAGAPLVDSTVAKPALEADATEPPAEELTDAQRFMVEGEDAFQRGDYAAARKSAEHALLEDAENGRVLLFVSQCLFAQGEFEQAISAAYQGLSMLEPADWGFVIANRDSYYTDKAAYPAQLAKLDKFIEDNPKAPFALALRGYHRGFAGDKAGAVADLKKAVELESRDEFAKQLLDLFSGTPKADAAPKAEAAPKGEEELILPPPAENK
jgi:hypothetical protein